VSHAHTPDTPAAPVTVRHAVAVLAGALVVGTLLTVVLAEVAFVDWRSWGSGTSVGPLAMAGAALAFLAVPIGTAARMRRRWPLAAIAVAVVPVALVFFVLVWPEVRDRL
jgi:cytochrome bd-type quinol oxidase subunit 2